MEWLNRLDEAMGEAVEANQRMNHRREQRHVNDTASLSQLVQHLRPGTTEDARSVGTSPAVLNSGQYSQTFTPQTNSSRQKLPRTTAQASTKSLDQNIQRIQDISTNDKSVTSAQNKDEHAPAKSTVSLSEDSPWGRALGSMSSPSKSALSPPRSKPITESEPLTNNNEEAIKPPLRPTQQKIINPTKSSMSNTLKETNYESDGSLEDVSLIEEHRISSAHMHDDSSNSQEPSGEQERLPQHVTLHSEFDVARVETDWNESGAPLDPKRNCYGVVHVRILRAKHLPCPVGSKVLAVIALPPWTGKVRTNKTTACFVKSSTPGVCADWSEMDSAAVSMVHAYSSEDSPVPSIRIGIFFSASSLGMLEMEMCHIKINCTALLREPLLPFQGWFATRVDKKGTRNKKQQSPLIQIEAMFEPENQHTKEENEFTKEESDDVPEVISSPVTTVEVDPSNIQVDDASLLDDFTQQSSQVDDTQEVPPPSSRSANVSISKTRATKTVNQDERSVSDFSTSLNSFRPADAIVSSSKMHLLGLKAYYVFARCHICSRSITSGFSRKAAYHCEQCGIDVCSDCRLQVDVRLPCGSKAAARAVENSLQSRLKPENIMNMVAPIPEAEQARVEGNKDKVSRVGVDDERHAALTNAPDVGRQSGNIGSMKCFVHRAVVPETPLGPTSFPGDVLSVPQVSEGDYYVRIRSSDGISRRTRTVQHSGRPRFSTGIELPVDHYQAEFCFELIDATTDGPVGQTILTAQAILQQQRDIYATSRIMPFVWIFGGPVGFNKTRRVCLELRKLKKTKPHTVFSRSSVGDIVGVIELDLILEEDILSLYGGKPTKCSPSPPEDLDLTLLQQHISRISNLVRDVKQLIKVYSYLVGWDSPPLTSLVALLYTYACLSIDLEYIGCLPFFWALILMIYLGFDRAQGRFQRRFLTKELDVLRELDVSGPNARRPLAVIEGRIIQGRNLRSLELGLPGSTSCKVSLDLGRLLTPNELKMWAAKDKAFAAIHEIGSTESILAQDPEWKSFLLDTEAKRLKQLCLFGEGSPLETDSTQSVFRFPVLQPGTVAKEKNIELQPWSSCPSAIVFEVRFSDLVSVIPGTSYTLGEVVIPIKIVQKEGRVKGWFQVHEAGSHPTLHECSTNNAKSDLPEIFLELKWNGLERVIDSTKEAGLEVSEMVQEEMVQAAVIRQQQKVTLFGSSIGALNTVAGLRTNLQSIQNILGNILDAFESVMNLFNFADPFKSTVVFLVLLIVWMILATIPTRWLMLTGGLAQFGAKLVAKLPLGRKKVHGERNESKEKANSNPPPFGIWMNNALLGLPTDEDLRRAYFWETQRVVEEEKLVRSAAKRKSRLSNFWHAKWHGEIQLVSQDLGKGYENAFGIIQGHRFLWWKSVIDFDNREPASGQIFLQGHAGLATPSPVQLKGMKKDELSRAAAIFGKGSSSQERVTLLCSSEKERQVFEDAILQTMIEKSD